MARNAIHILGIGNLAKLIAHSLRKSQPATPVVLLFHRPSLVTEWTEASQQIDIIRNEQSDPQQGLGYELVSEGRGSISNLIVATKTYATADALQPLRTRLNQSSTMLFVQNGIGTIDEVTTKVFPQTEGRPRYLAGIFNHGIIKKSTFSSIHAGLANIIVGPVPSGINDRETTGPGSSSSIGYLESQLLGCPDLNMSLISHEELLQVQLQKLAVNAVINPLSTIFDCVNGELFEKPEICTMMRELIEELSAVMTAILKAQNDDINPTQLSEVSPERLESIVWDIGIKNAKNISSMRQDVLAGRRTEIDYMNGYIATQAAIHGVAAPLNSMIIDMIRSKSGL